MKYKELYTYMFYARAIRNWENGKRSLNLKPFWRVVKEEVLRK